MLTGLVGCTGEETSVVLRFNPNPNLNSEAEMVEQISILELLLDAEGGFHGVQPGSLPTHDFISVDSDQDGDLELLARLELSQELILPRIRLDPGSNQATSIALKARGLDTQEQLVAFGGLPPSRLFASGEKRYVSLPFNLVPDRRSWTIAAVMPGPMPQGAVLESIGFIASRPLNRSSLSEHLRLLLVTGEPGAEQESPIEFVLEDAIACPLGQEMWRLRPSQCVLLDGGKAQLRLLIDPQAQDNAQRQLSPLAGPNGLDKMIDLNPLQGFGPCSPVKSCVNSGTMVFRPDLICDPQSGRLKPAPCSATSGACQNEEYVFSWISVDDADECLRYRLDSFQSAGFCFLTDPWPCQSNTDCGGLSGKRCDQQTQQCQPIACSGACADEELACAGGQGCLPRLARCVLNCGFVGGCPEFNQGCQAGEAGGQVCQVIQ
jgi:hypothetical protein